MTQFGANSDRTWGVYVYVIQFMVELVAICVVCLVRGELAVRETISCVVVTSALYNYN